MCLVISYHNRPDWSRCAEFIEGGLDKWAEISEGRTSDELVDVLLSQIAGVDISEVTRHEVFQGQVCPTHTLPDTTPTLPKLYTLSAGQRYMV